MKTIAMVGSYSEDVIPMIQSKMPEGFRIVEIPDYESFGSLPEVDYIVLRTLKLDSNVISSLKKARLIHRWGAGFDSVDIEAAGSKEIQVAITAGVNSAAVSELAVALMLSVYRHISTLDNMLKSGCWERQAFIDKSFMIKGKTIGLIGCGNIGRLVAEKLQVFGADVIYYDVFRMSPEREGALGLRYAALDELLASADIISVHVPLMDSTKEMINCDMFNKMKPSAVFINTARGTVVNEDDLVDALQNGRIAGAGLDSYAIEPLTADSLITKCPNVVLTPHVGGNTCDIGGEMVERILSNIAKVDAGERLSPPDLVNRQYLK